MTRTDFLSDPHVQGMTVWMAARFEAPCSWTHNYVNRKTGAWSCISLFDAFRQYSWRKKSWAATKAELDCYRRLLRSSVATRNTNDIVDVCSRILRWGGVSARNADELTNRRSTLLNELKRVSDILDGDHTPSRRELGLGVLAHSANETEGALMSSLIQFRGTIAGLIIGVVTAAITMGLLWPFMGDPVVAVVEIGAAVLMGTAIGGTCYLILSEKRQQN